MQQSNKTLIKDIMEYFKRTYDLSSTEVVCLFERSIKEELEIKDEINIYFNHIGNKISIQIIQQDCRYVNIKLTSKTIKKIYSIMEIKANYISLRRRIVYINQFLKKNRIIMCKLVDTEQNGYIFESQFGKVFLPNNKCDVNIHFKLFSNYYLFIEKVGLLEERQVNIVANFNQNIITPYVINKLIQEPKKIFFNLNKIVVYTNSKINEKIIQNIKDFLPHIKKIDNKINNSGALLC